MSMLRSNLHAEPEWTAYDIRFLRGHHIASPVGLDRKTTPWIRNLVLALLIAFFTLAAILLFQQGRFL